MTTFSLQKDFFNITSGKKHFQMWFPDECKQPNLPPVNEAYEFMKAKGLPPERILQRLINAYMPFRIVKGGHLTNRTMVTALIGARGSGKSATGSMITLFDYLIRGVPTWSNMEIKATFRYKDCEVEYATRDIEKMDIFNLDEALQGGCVFLDEINLEYSEARRSTTKANLLFNKMLQQLRHRDLDLVYTTQMEESTDKRLRFSTDLYCLCKDVALSPAGREYGAQIGNFCYLDAYDYSGVFTGKSFKNYDKPIWTGMIWIKPFWNCYDTYQMQAMGDEPEVGIQIKESERLKNMKTTLGPAQTLLDFLKSEGHTEVPANILWEVAGVDGSDIGKMTSLGMALQRLGVTKFRTTGGEYVYVMPE